MKSYVVSWPRWLSCMSDWLSGSHGSDPWAQQNSFVEIDRGIFSMVIFSLPLIQEGQLSASGERICANTG